MQLLVLIEAEHARFRKILDVAQAELARLDDGLEHDRELLSAVADYWQAYPDACHHPKEDRVLRELVRRGAPGAQRLAEHVAGEHQALAALGAELVEVVRREAADEPGASNVDVGDVLSRFVDANREHMAQEEAEFFPLARRCLTPSDWSAIEFDVLDREDPIIDRSAETRYANLREAILVMSERRAEEAHRRRLREQLFLGDAAWLRDVTTVAEFNEVVGRGAFGGGIELRRTESGRWSLLVEGRPVAAVPDCGEARAVWCAYFFLLGAERGYPPDERPTDRFRD